VFERYSGVNRTVPTVVDSTPLGGLSNVTSAPLAHHGSALVAVSAALTPVTMELPILCSTSAVEIEFTYATFRRSDKRGCT